MWKQCLALSLIALTTLMIELLLTRVFDVILTPNMSYMVVTMALFAFGIAGVYSTLRPISSHTRVNLNLALFSFVFGIFILLIRPAFNFLPFDFYKFDDAPITQSLLFIGMYITMALPFFFAGLIFTTIFSSWSKKIQVLYFWDLMGAGLGCIIIIPFLKLIGPGGEMMVGAALALVASGLFSNNRNWLVCCSVIAVILVVVPFAKSPKYYAFDEHFSKRGVKQNRDEGKIEATIWDPISKIDIVNEPRNTTVATKHIAYDGGQQSSHLFSFDGDLEKLRHRLNTGAAVVSNHFWFPGVLASHYLKRDSNQDVLIIGSAGGQETKAALIYGAGSVDAVELVGTVVDLVSNQYANYIGNIFRDPRVTLIAGEGRSYLRRQDKKYDIIQIFSNHTSSSVASGTGAVQTTYLQTADAYREYFDHLKPDGILHVNHRYYVKLITTAALAWKQLGKNDFRKHVVVFHRNVPADTLPTFLVKLSPWTESEIDALKRLLASSKTESLSSYIVEDPIHPDHRFLNDAFFSGELSEKLISDMPYRVEASTDDRPYFKFIRKSFGHLEENPEIFLDRWTSGIINQMTKKRLPMDVLHLFVTGFSSILFCILFIFVPLYFSEAGQAKWPERKYTLIYFSCLGAGFIIFELVFIQIFMKLIGSPLYTYSMVVFTLLFAAGIGSLSSSKLKFHLKARQFIPFAGILFTGVLFTLSYQIIFDHFLKFGIYTRLLVSFIMIFPLGFFLGMPFPLGILCISDRPNGAIAWAWAMNGLFTVMGGMASIILSVFYGFQATLMVALLIYLIAIFMHFKQNPSFAA